MKYSPFANLPAQIRNHQNLRAEAESVQAKNARQAELRRIADAKAAAELAAERAVVEAKAAEAEAQTCHDASICRMLVECFLADLNSAIEFEDIREAKRARRERRAASRAKRDDIDARTRANQAARKAKYAAGFPAVAPQLRMKGGWDCVESQRQFGTQTTSGWGWAWGYIPVHKRTFEKDAVQPDPEHPGHMRRVSRVQFDADEIRRTATGSTYRFRRVSDSEAFKCPGIEVRWTGVPNSQATGGYDRRGISTPDGIARNGMCFPVEDSEREVQTGSRTGANSKTVHVMRTNSKGKRVYRRA